VILADPDSRLVIAHRGESAHAPENTLEALRRGVEAGADAIEFDLRLTADGEVVVMHDPTVDRTTDGSGPVWALTLRRLQELDAGYRFAPEGKAEFPFRGAGLRVPSFREVLEAFPDTPLLIELKEPEAAGPARALIERHEAAERVLVDSAVPAALVPFRGTRILYGASSDGAFALLKRAWSRPAGNRHQFSAVCIPYRHYGLPVPVGRMATAAAAGGAATHVWTVNDPRLAQRFWVRGVNGIVTNYPREMVRLRDSLPPRKTV
jgi:glycerophosphoryl diester phosphodiesterase